MKRLIGQIIFLTLVSFALAIAQQDQQKQPEKQPTGQTGMMHQMMQGDMQGRMRGPGGGPMDLPKLTEEQQAKMQDLRLAHQKEILPLRNELQKQQTNLILELTADKFSDSKVTSIQAEISKLTGQIAAAMVQHLRAVRDLLTPDQKKVFDQHILSGDPMGPGGMMGQGMMRDDGMMGPRAGAQGPCCSGECKCMQ